MKDIVSTIYDKKPRTFIFEKLNELTFFAVGYLAYDIDSAIIAAVWVAYLIVEVLVRSLELNKKHRSKTNEKLEEMGLK